MKLSDRTLATLERALDARLLRQNVLAGNLANADTPGFVPREVDFAAAMSALRPEAPAAAPLAPGHIALEGAATASPAAGQPASPIVAAQGSAAGIDGNAVDVDRTLVAVAENAIQYGAAARAVQKKLAILRYAASDGAA